MSSGRAGREQRRRLGLIVAVAVAVLAIDQVTKTLAVDHLSRHPVHILGSIWLRLEYNSGVAFSIGTGLTGVIVVVVVLLVIGVIWFGSRVPTALAAFAVGLVLGGALGNLSDRIFRGHHGAVVDFLYTRYWPTFNAADSAVVIGCILLAWSVLRSPGGWNRPPAPVESAAEKHSTPSPPPGEPRAPARGEEP